MNTQDAIALFAALSQTIIGVLGLKKKETFIVANDSDRPDRNLPPGHTKTPRKMRRNLLAMAMVVSGLLFFILWLASYSSNIGGRYVSFVLGIKKSDVIVYDAGFFTAKFFEFNERSPLGHEQHSTIRRIGWAKWWRPPAPGDPNPYGIEFKVLEGGKKIESLWERNSKAVWEKK
jgi:hypothetical protein